MATTLINSLTPRPFLPQLAFPWVIFDMDGTLVDTFGLHQRSFNFAVKRTLTTREMSAIPGGTLEEELTNFMPVRAVPRAIERYYAHYTRHFDSGSRVYPGIRGLLFTLHAKGVELAVCTGSGRQIAHYTLARSGLSQFFMTVVTADDVSEPKPDGEGLRLVMDRISADSDHTVYVGDHPNDIAASRNAGVKSAAARWGSKHRSELQALKPDFLFRHPSEALTLSDLSICTYPNPDLCIHKPYI